MKQRLLIEALLDAFAELAAFVAVYDNRRVSLHGLDDALFIRLANRLEGRGLGRKVVADMFGLQLRSYQKKTQRLSTPMGSGETLWEEVFTWLRANGPANRAAVLTEFFEQDPAQVAAVLNDLVESGLAFRTGRGDSTRFGLLPGEMAQSEDELTVLSDMVWCSINYRPGLTEGELATTLPLEPRQFKRALHTLVQAGRVQREEAADSHGAEPTYVVRDAHSGVAYEIRWQAALLTHIEAVIHTALARLDRPEGYTGVLPNEGFVTAYFDVHDAHPCRDDVESLLAELRTRVDDLARRVDEYNDTHPEEPPTRRVVFHSGLAADRLDPRADEAS